MELHRAIESYLQNPYPQWNVNLANVLRDWKWIHLANNSSIQNVDQYATANVLLDGHFHKSRFQQLITDVYLEGPDILNLANFYREHALEPASKQELEKINAVEQLRKALDFLNFDTTCRAHIQSLVRCVQVLKQPEPEFDVSYSHPDIPFTIFVSIGEAKSPVDIIRLAESILHETMHLKLTLIEGLHPLIDNNEICWFSPWRDEERPVRGVLHGMFVFRAILDFYELVLPITEDVEMYDFIDWRIEQIKSELLSLNGFTSSRGLTSGGAILARNLLP